MTTTTSLRSSRVRLLMIAAALIAVLALVAALIARSGPPVIQIGAGAQGQPASAEMADDARLWRPVTFEFELTDGARFPAGEGPAYRLEAPRSLRAAASALAAYFGLEEPSVPPHGDGGYVSGSTDGTGPSLWVGANGDWYFSDTGRGDVVYACVEPAMPPDRGDGTSGSSGDAATPDVDEGDGPVVEPEPCPEPSPPTGVPSEDEARQAATALFAELDLPGTPQDIHVYADEWGAWVRASIPFDGRPSDVFASAGYGAEGALVSAGGTLAKAAKVADYPTVDADQAVERLASGEHWGGIAASAEMRPAADRAIHDGAVTDPGRPADLADPVDPGEPVSSDGSVVDDVIEDGEDYDDHYVEGELEVVTVRLVSAQPTLTMHYDIDGTIWLLPGVAFTDDTGGTWQVMTVADGYIEFTEPQPEPMPEPTPVGPPDAGPPVDPDEGDAPAPQYQELAERVVGMTDAEAVRTIELEGAVARVVSIDGEGQIVTDDLRYDRVNLWLEDGIVVRADVY